MVIIGEPILNVNRRAYVFLKDNKHMTIFGERLKKARVDAGLSQGELAKLVGIKQGSVAEAEAIGKSSKKILEYAKALKVNPEWLATGKGKQELTNNQIVKNDFIEDAKANSLNIPLLAIYGSMGNGNENHDGDLVVDVLRITKQWADKTLNNVTRISNLRFIHAIGDSMQPTFNDGDILLVDTGVKTVSSDSVYVLDAHDRLFIKRVRRRMDGTFEISSDNPSVKTVDILNGDNEVEIKGRVVWVWNGKRV